MSDDDDQTWALGPTITGAWIYNDLGPTPRRIIGRPLWALAAILDRASIAAHRLGRRPNRATYVQAGEPEPGERRFQAILNESGIFTIVDYDTGGDQ